MLTGASGTGRAAQHAAAMDCAALLGGPLLRAAHALVLTRAPSAPAAGAAAASGKASCRKGGRGGLHASAVAAVAALLALCRCREALRAALGGAAEAPAAPQAAGTVSARAHNPDIAAPYTVEDLRLS